MSEEKKEIIIALKRGRGLAFHRHSFFISIYTPSLMPKLTWRYLSSVQSQGNTAGGYSVLRLLPSSIRQLPER